MIIGNALLDNEKKNIVIENGVITEIRKPGGKFDIDAENLKVLPGLIDIHTHGGMGKDTMDGEFKFLARYHALNGTTSFLPTTMTESIESLKKVDNALEKCEGANVLGLHFEGPYISPAKKGAQNEAFIRKPDFNEFCRFKNVKMITVAPETEGCMEFINKVSKETVVCIGHTAASYQVSKEAIENGASCLTHTFNAMPPILHREPGPIGAAAEKHIYAQIICDGLHVHKAAFLAAYKMFGADRMILISDSIRPAGLPDGVYQSGGLKVKAQDGELRLEDGTLAGSNATLLYCVKKAVEFGIPEIDAVKMATETPASLLKVKKGRIEPGFDGDIILTDNEFNLKKVIIGGKEYN